MKKKVKKLRLNRETIVELERLAGGTFEDTGITCTICDIPIDTQPFGRVAGPPHDHDRLCA